ncbi:hypothetical protein D3C71_1202340 [compost metagenome]
MRHTGFALRRVAHHDVGQAIAVDITDGDAVGLAHRRKALADPYESTLAVPQEQVVLLGVFSDEQHIDMAVTINIGHAYMLVVAGDRAERIRRLCELAGAIVEIEPVGAILHRHRDIQIAIAIGIQQRRIQCMEVRVGGNVGGGDVGKHGARRLRRASARRDGDTEQGSGEGEGGDR